MREARGERSQDRQFFGVDTPLGRDLQLGRPLLHARVDLRLGLLQLLETPLGRVERLCEDLVVFVDESAQLARVQSHVPDPSQRPSSGEGDHGHWQDVRKHERQRATRDQSEGEAGPGGPLEPANLITAAFGAPGLTLALLDPRRRETQSVGPAAICARRSWQISGESSLCAGSAGRYSICADPRRTPLTATALTLFIRGTSCGSAP